MTDTRTVVLIDLSSIYWAAWHASGNDEMSTARTATLSGIDRCRNAAPADALVAICCDSGRSFRKELLPEYKAQRPEKDHAAVAELQKVQDRLRTDGYLLWSAPTFEADDVIATATEQARKAGHAVMIASADKDLLQLVRPGVTCLRTHVWDMWDTAKVEEKFGVPTSKLGDWLALVGDKSDNIAGAKGVGPKTATSLLTAHGNLRGLYSALFAGAEGFTPAVKQSLVDCSKAVELARKLVTLRTDAPIEFEAIYRERAQLRLLPQTTEGEEMDDETADAEPTPEKTPEPAPVATDPAAMNDQSTALVPVTYKGPYELALEPTNIGQAYKLARGLYESRLYQRYQNPEAIWAVIIRGREMGLGALTALDCFHLIEGSPKPQAHLIIARAKAHPDCEYFRCITPESSSQKATWETKNRKNPEPTRLTYTIEQAKTAGLLGPTKSGKPSNWVTRPDEMLRKTAGVQLARLEYPEASLGLYATEELDAA